MFLGLEHEQAYATLAKEQTPEEQAAENKIAKEKREIAMMYDDEYDDTFDSMPNVPAGRPAADESGSENEEERWAHWTQRGKGGKIKGGRRK